MDFIKKLSPDNIKVEVKFNDLYNEKRYYVFTILNISTSKGNAIYGLCKFLKIDINDVIAIGDDANDISMIKAVGMGIAMGNAGEDIKKIAKEITKTNNENGVAEVINKKILNLD